MTLAGRDDLITGFRLRRSAGARLYSPEILDQLLNEVIRKLVDLSPQLAAKKQTAVRPSLRVSIIIVNYNAKEKLVRCLESVLRSSEPDCEVIVVDNNSSDGIADLIETYFRDVRLIRSQTNLGFGAGNNLAAREAHGEYFVFLNPDTLVQQGWLEALLAPFDSDPRVGLVTSKILLADEPERINTCGNAVHFTGLTLCRGLGQPREAFNKMEEVDAVSGAAFAIRYELFAALQGFEEDAFLYMEDTDLSWRARLMGWRCVYAPDSVALHHYNLRIGPEKVFYQERNRYLMLLKTLRWRTMLILLPAQLLTEVMTWGFVLYNDRAHFKNKLRAYVWIINNWSDIMRKRKGVQEQRCVRDRELLRHTTFNLDFNQAASGMIGNLAGFVFNPLFWLLRAVAVMVVRW
jgi:GT2 family glycosyltransferase